MRRLDLLQKKIPNVVYLFTGLVAIFSFISPNFFSVENLSNLILQGSVLLIISLGMTLVMLSNGIDLSVGSLMSLCGMVAGISLSRGLGLIPALCFGLLIGLFSGMFIGLLIARLKFSPFIATFGMMGVFEGISLFSNRGSQSTGRSRSLTSLAMDISLTFHFPFGLQPFSLGSSMFFFIRLPSG